MARVLVTWTMGKTARERAVPWLEPKRYAWGLIYLFVLAAYVVKGEENLKVGDPQPEAQNKKGNMVEVDLSGKDGHRDVVNTLKSKVGSRTVDNFMAQALSSVVTEKPVEGLMADFAQQVGGDSDPKRRG